MARTAPRPEPRLTKELTPLRVNCPHCGHRMRADYRNRRTIATLAGLTRLQLTIRRCHHHACAARRRPDRPEAEGRLALPHHEFGLDVIALIGRLRYAEDVLEGIDACPDALAGLYRGENRGKRVIRLG